MGTSLILGFFDGVHLGHQAVINSAINFGSEKNVMLTFKKSPAEFFCGKTEYILSRDESVKKIKKLGVNDVIFQHFEEIYKQSADEYLENIIEKYHPISISTGFNYTFGFNKKGDSNFLEQEQKKYNYKYICTPPQKYENEIISSTLIKNCLKSGNIKKANALLGSEFSIEGTVVEGAKIGRTIGFPTANLAYPQNIAEIPYGAYAVKYENFYGIMNYGIKPTLNGKSPIAEVHIFDFNENLYGKNIKVQIIERIRNEQKFNNLEELKKQIEKDKKACLELLS